jgi:hypothetical protein
MEALDSRGEPTEARNLLDMVGKTGMSEEESDYDSSGPIIRILRPLWRSDALHQFLHGLDTTAQKRGSHRIIHTTNHRAEVVLRLPSDCYSSEHLPQKVGPDMANGDILNGQSGV